MAKDPETKKISPFFVKVRNEDIITTKKILIDDCLHATSGMWYLDFEKHMTDMSIYQYSLKNTTKDVGDVLEHGEKLPVKNPDLKVIYKLYKFGYYEVECIFDFDLPEEGANNQSVFIIPLPYALTGISTVSPYLIPVGRYQKTMLCFDVEIGKSEIENTVLAVNDDVNKYAYKVCLYSNWNMLMSSESGSGKNPLENTPEVFLERPNISFKISGFFT